MANIYKQYPHFLSTTTKIKQCYMAGPDRQYSSVLLHATSSEST